MVSYFYFMFIGSAISCLSNIVSSEALGNSCVSDVSSVVTFPDENKTVADIYIEISDGMKTYDTFDEHNCEPDLNTNNKRTTEDSTEDKDMTYSKMWLDYKDFKDLADNMYNAMERNRKYSLLICGQMLRNLDFLNKV